jgi:indole-3-glycerol phosphate synthase
MRAAGADAICIQAAMWPIKDIGYQCKAAKVLGLACVVEVHSSAQLEAVLAAGPGASALLLCARNPDSLDGDAASFETLYAPFAEQLQAFGVPLIAEAAIGDDAGAAATLCPNADAVLCGMPRLH